MSKMFQQILILASVFFISCNEAATDADKDTDTTTATANSDAMPEYNAAMDPLNVEGTLATKLGDSLNIKMYVVTLKPGDSAMLHTHPDHTVYVLEGGKLAITPQGAERQEVDFQKGTGLLLGPQTHSGKNIGNTTVRLLVHDIYRPRGR